jgi:hypothetical protein
MNAITIRQELHEYINTADDKQLKAIYAIIKDEVNEPYEWWNDEDLVAELDKRAADLKSGKDKGFTIEESMVHLRARLNKNG